MALYHIVLVVIDEEKNFSSTVSRLWSEIEVKHF
jgi:hypothetical protein